MNAQHITELAQQLQNEMPFMKGIHTPDEHEQALILMDELIEDYDKNQLLIDILFPKIEAYEEQANEYFEFNERIKNMEPGASMLRLLMEHHKLNTTDFQNEIGGKSTVSMICNEKRKLTTGHIKKLSERFGVSADLFF